MNMGDEMPPPRSPAAQPMLPTLIPLWSAHLPHVFTTNPHDPRIVHPRGQLPSFRHPDLLVVAAVDELNDPTEELAVGVFREGRKAVAGLESGQGYLVAGRVCYYRAPGNLFVAIVVEAFGNDQKLGGVGW